MKVKLMRRGIISNFNLVLYLDCVKKKVDVLIVV